MRYKLYQNIFEIIISSLKIKRNKPKKSNL